jgi:hypothetical protein
LKNVFYPENLEMAKQWLRADPKLDVPIKDLWTDKPLTPAHFPLAGAFVAHLWEWGGKEKL